MNDSDDFNVTSEYTVRAENLSFSVLVNKMYRDLPAVFGGVGGNVSEAMHTHAYNELFLCLDGITPIKTPEGVISLSAGDMLLIPTAALHIKLPCEAKWASVGFHFFRLKSKGSNDLCSILNELCHGERPRRITGMPELCAEIYAFLCEAPGRTSGATALHILDALIRMSEANVFADAVRGSDAKIIDRDLWRMSQLERYYELYFSRQDISLSDIAARLCVSERQLTRMTKARFGMSFHEVISERRLETARRKLVETTLSVEEIGHSVGYMSMSVFYKAFRKKFGVPPGKYRCEAADRLTDIGEK